MKRAGVSVTGVLTVVMHPPGQQLPEELTKGLKHIEDVATATGTQVLEMRDSNAPYADDFSVGGRQKLATLYIALGDAEGNPIRELARERAGGLWRNSPYVLNLAASQGLSRREYEDLGEPLSSHLPPADDPEVQAKVRPRKSDTSAGLKEFKRPWISFAGISLLIDQREPITTQSDQVRSGHEDQGG